MQGGEELSIEELVSNLSTYKEQLRQVRKLLSDDPGNLEYADMEKELEEVITLTEELLTTAQQAELSGLSSSKTNVDGSPSLPHSGTSELKLDSDMPSEFHEFPVGTKVQAVYSEDGEWYDATIEGLTPNGYYVSYDGWGNKEECLDWWRERVEECEFFLLEATLCCVGLLLVCQPIGHESRCHPTLTYKLGPSRAVEYPNVSCAWMFCNLL